jgi:hypothetical protein
MDATALHRRGLRNKAAAEFLGVAPGTLVNWRVKGCGPAFYKLNGHIVVYLPEDLEAYLAGNRRQSTSEYHN